MTKTLRGMRLGLLVSTCLMGGAMPARAQTGVAFQGNVVLPTGASLSSTGDTDTIRITAPSTVLDWTATGPVQPGNVVDFLPAGRTGAFVGAAGLADYVVLNRVVPAGSGADPAAIAFNGTITSRITPADGGALQPGGAIWFYSPGGIIAGPSALFDIGSLLLTTNSVAIGEGLDRNRIETRPTGLGGTAVTIMAGARIAAQRAGSYVAIVAPRVTQDGAVSVNGSAAYVASDPATLSINRGLFDITFSSENGPRPTLVHRGSTTGPAAVEGSGEAHRIYMVSMPANDAVTMLVGGTLGFDAAASASSENGIVVLAAGTGVNDRTATSTETATPTGLSITGARFTSRVEGTALGPIDVRSITSADTVSFGQGASLRATGGISMVADGGGAAITGAGGAALRTTEGGAADVLIRAAGGGAVSLGGRVAVDTTPEGAAARGQAPGAIRLEGNGGTLSLGTTTLTANGTGVGTGRGGTVAIGLSNATLDATELVIDVSGDGGGRPLVAGQGGDVSIIATADTRINIFAGLSIDANGRGGSNGEPFASGGTGGTVLIDSAGTLTIGQLANIVANGSGFAGGTLSDGDIDVRGSDGQGGQVRLNLAGATTLRSLQIDTIGIGGAGGRTDGTGGTGGAGAGGTIALTARGPLAAQDVLLRASAIGGGGTSSGDGREGGNGGTARGGSAAVRTEGVTSASAIGVSADATGGAGTGAGTDGRGGAAVAGDASFVATGPSTRLSDSFGVTAFATGGVSEGDVAGGLATGGTATIDVSGDFVSRAIFANVDAVGRVDENGTIVGGQIDLTARGTLTARETMLLNARAILAGGTVNNGTVRGGAIAVRAAGGGTLVSREDMRVDASASGRGDGAVNRTVNAVGGSLILATAAADAPAGATGGTIDAQQNVLLTTEAFGGEANDAGNAQGGAITVDVTRGGTLGIAGTFDVTAGATAGRNYDSRGGTATGGDVLLSGAEGSGITVGGGTTINSSAIIGYAGGSAARTNRGGNVTVFLNGGADPAQTRLSLNDLLILSNGSGGTTGGGFGGNGAGGSVVFDLRRATSRMASLTVEARGVANRSEFGGDGTGGAIMLAADGGTLDVAGTLGFTASGIGAGTPDLYGTGRGGSAIVEAIGDARINLATVRLTADGGHQDANGPALIGTSRLAAVQGTIGLDNALLFLDAVVGQFGPALRAEATAVGDVRIDGRDDGTDSYVVGSGPAELRLDVADGGTGPYQLLAPGASALYAGPGGGRYAILNRVSLADPSRRVDLAGRITGETPGDITFLSAGGIALTNGGDFSGGRLVLTTDAGAGAAFQGTPTVIDGSVRFDRTTTLDTITLGSRTALIDWTPRDTGPAGAIDFLPAGRTALFRGGPDFTVLNRVLPAAAGRPVAFNGTVASQTTVDGGTFVPGGNVWFYSPGGIVAGASAVFDVGSLLLSANAVQFNGGFNVFQNDGSVRLVADAGSLADVSVMAGATLSARGAGGSVTLAAPRIEQAGDVTADRFIGYGAARDVSVDAARNLMDVREATAGGGGGLIHSGRSGITGSDAGRVVLAAARADAGAAVLAGGQFGLAPGDLDVAILAGRNAAGAALAQGNDALLKANAAGGRFAISASGAANVDASGVGSYDYRSLSVNGATATVNVGGEAALNVAENLTITGAADSARMSVAGVAVVGGVTTLDASANGGDATGGVAQLIVTGAMQTGALRMVAGATGQSAAGGVVVVDTAGTLRVNGDADLRAAAVATGGTARGGIVQLAGSNASSAAGMSVGGGLTADASAQTTGGADVFGGGVQLALAGAALNVGGSAALAADARRDGAFGGSGGTITTTGARELSFGGLALSARGDAGTGGIAVAGPGGITVDGNFDATTTNTMFFTADRFSVRDAATLSATGAIGFDRGSGGTALSARRIAITAGGGLETSGRALSGGEIILQAASIAAGDLNGNLGVSAVAVSGGLTVGRVTGGAVRLQAAGLLTLNGGAMDSGTLGTSDAIVLRGALTAGATLSIDAGGAVQLADADATVLRITGASVEAGALTARGGALEVISRGVLSTGAIDGGVTATLTAAGRIATGAIRAEQVIQVEGGSLTVAGDVRGGAVTLVTRGGGMTLANVGGTALTFDSATDVAAGTLTANQALTLTANGVTRLSGPANAGGNFTLVTGGAATTGDVTAAAIAIGGIGLATGDLAARGGGLTISGGSGAVSTGALSATGALAVNGGAVVIGAARAGSVLTVAGNSVSTGQLGATAMVVEARSGDALIAGATGGGLRVTAARDITLGNSNVGGGVTLGAGRDATLDTLASGDLTLTAGGTATLGTITGGRLSLTAARLTAGTLDARDAIDANAIAGRLTIGQARARRDLTLTASDGVDLTFADTDGDAIVRSALLGAGNLSIDAGGAITTRGIARDGAILLTAGGAITTDAIRGAGLTLRGGTLQTATLTATAGGIAATATNGALRFVAAEARDDVTLSANAGLAGGAVSGRGVTLRGGLISVGALGATDGAIDALSQDRLSFGSVATRSDVRLTATTNLTGGAVNGRGVVLRGGTISVGALNATDGAIDAVSQGAFDFASAMGRGDVRLTAATGLTGGAASGSGVVLRGASIAVGTLDATGGDLDLASTGPLRFDSATARGDARLVARDGIDFASLVLDGNARIDGGLAGTRDLAMRAGGAIDILGAITREGAVSLVAGGALTLGDARAASLALRGVSITGGLLRSAGAIDAGATGGALTLAAVDGGAVTVAATGRIDTSSIRGGDVRVDGDLTGAGALAIDASGTADVRGAIRRGGALLVRANRLALRDATAGTIVLRADAITGGILTATTGGIDAAARDGTLTLAAATAPGDVTLAATRGVNVGLADAGGRLAIDGGLIGSGDLALLSGGGLVFSGDIDRAGAVTLETDGDLSLRGVAARAVTLRGATIVAGDVTARDGGVAARSGGGMRVGTVTASADAKLTGGAALEFATVAAGGGASLQGTRITGGDVTVRTDLAGVATTGGIALANVSGAAVTLTAATDIAIGAIIAGGATTLDAKGGIATAGDIGTRGTLDASTGTLLSLRNVTAGTARLRGARVATGSLSAADGIDAAARGGDLSVGTLSTTRALTLAAAGGALTLGTVSAGTVALSGEAIGGRDVTATGAVTATSGGALALGPITAGGALTLTGGAITLGDVTATTASLRGASIVGATLGATGGVEARASAGPLRFATISAGGPLTLAATGDLMVGRLDAAGVLDARGAGVMIGQAVARGGLSITADGSAVIDTLTDTAGGITLAATSADINGLAASGAITATVTDALTVRQAASRTGIALTSLEGDVTAAGLTTAFQSGAAITPAVVARPGDIAIAAARDVRLGTANARGLLRIDAGGVARVDGVAGGTTIEVASADVAIAPAGRLGNGIATTSVRFAVKPGTRAFIGGSGGDGGYSLDDGEIGRVRARQIILSAGRAGSDAGRPADVTVGALALRHEGAAGEASLYGDAALFRVETPGTTRVTGQVSGTSFGRDDRVEFVSGERLDIVAPGGAIVLAGAGGAPSGRLLLSSDRVVVATQGAAREVETLSTARERTDRLGLTDGAVAPGGYVSADRLDFNIGRALYIQNSGGPTLEARAGFTAGQGGLSINGAGAGQPEVIINGRGVDGGGIVTRSGAAFQPTLTATAPGSSINGCSDGGGLCAPTLAVLDTTTPAIRATTGSALLVVQGMEAVDTGTGVSSAISSISGVPDPEGGTDGEADEGGDKPAGRANARVLIATRGIANTSLMPLVDEPVTSVGNDDFWLDTMMQSAFQP